MKVLQQNKDLRHTNMPMRWLPDQVVVMTNENSAEFALRMADMRDDELFMELRIPCW